MDSFKQANPHVVRTTKPVPADPKILDREIRKQRILLDRLKQEPQRCRLLKKERQNWDVARELDATRINTRERLAICSQKADAFDKKQLELKNVVLNNESFIKDTDLKCERAEKKARDENAACKRLDEEIVQVGQLYEEKLTEREEELQDIMRQMTYRKFLDDAAKLYYRQKTTEFVTAAKNKKLAIEGDGARATIEDKAGATFLTQQG
ncbi:unnamed protein product [Amoebophrya sp. A25]|nr:unnamed protein product [Amoebophrya sp. A25]|eukprot:GSA25T00004616001.1